MEALAIPNGFRILRLRALPLRLLYVVTEDWYFLLHRLPMALAAREAGFEVHVATQVGNGCEAIEKHGFKVHPVPFARGRISPLASMRTIAALRRIHRQLRPTVTHYVALQAVVLGSMAALGLPGARVNAFTGLGHVFVSSSVRTRILREFIRALLPFLLNRPNTVVLVENPDDRSTLAALGIATHQILVIPGSGVDVERLRPLPEPSEPETIAFVGRLIESKGIRTLVEAQRLLQLRGSKIRLLIAGRPDQTNPNSVTAEEAAAWDNEPSVTYLGHVKDIADTVGACGNSCAAVKARRSSDVAARSGRGRTPDGGD